MEEGRPHAEEASEVHGSEERHGEPGVDAQYTEGATAAFAALTAPRGAFLITTTLGKLAMVGLLLQMANLVGTRAAPLWAPVVAVAGCAVVVLFWDIDNLMMVGEALVLAGAWPMRGRPAAMPAEAPPKGEPGVATRPGHRTHPGARGAAAGAPREGAGSKAAATGKSSAPPEDAPNACPADPDIRPPSS